MRGMICSDGLEAAAESVTGKLRRFKFPPSAKMQYESIIELNHAKVPGRISGRVAIKILPDRQVEPELTFRVKMEEALIPKKTFEKSAFGPFWKTS